MMAAVHHLGERGVLMRPNLVENTTLRGPCTEWVLAQFAQPPRFNSTMITDTQRRSLAHELHTSQLAFKSSPTGLAARSRSVNARYDGLPSLATGPVGERHLMSKMDREMVRVFVVTL